MVTLDGRLAELDAESEGFRVGLDFHFLENGELDVRVLDFRFVLLAG
jgi:hypothetical protein